MHICVSVPAMYSVMNKVEMRDCVHVLDQQIAVKIKINFACSDSDRSRSL